jgi:uncharacterized protein (DUF433 family)
MNKIISNPNIRSGKPCIRGTRIAVTDILGLISAGYSLEEIPEQYPGLTSKDILAAISFATTLADEPSRIISKPLAHV